jgi:hypothetical protein
MFQHDQILLCELTAQEGALLRCKKPGEYARDEGAERDWQHPPLHTAPPFSVLREEQMHAACQTAGLRWADVISILVGLKLVELKGLAGDVGPVAQPSGGWSIGLRGASRPERTRPLAYQAQWCVLDGG